MSHLLYQRTGLIVQLRKFSGAVVLRDAKPSSVNTTSAQRESPSVFGPQMHKLTNFQKRVLVFARRYPSMADVPDKVTTEVLTQSQSKARIRASNFLLVFTALGCIFMIYSGKKEAEQGVSLTKINQEWHKKINEEYKKSLETQGNK
ncbi:UPF0389 protein CG9231 [Cephus cinctus]|uniref:UPF0389 protein CG9231 n=1 Tax=Cephus cinctus TaxID=211228 RepID=A0AAJ7VZC1_CEPCN|nr:UPF0389 protein CG9231 [Cephus cinctus]